MPSNSDTRDAARQRAQNHFTASEQRDTAIKQEIARERAATEAQIAKLRALRLAKEAEDARVAAEAPAAEPETKSRKARAPKAKKPRRITV